MCFTITEETSETFHSALGSSGRFLEGKERDFGYLPSSVQQWFTEKQEYFVSAL